MIIHDFNYGMKHFVKKHNKKLFQNIRISFKSPTYCARFLSPINVVKPKQFQNCSPVLRFIKTLKLKQLKRLPIRILESDV